jgi:hypothetical protein
MSVITISKTIKWLKEVYSSINETSETTKL